MKRFRQHNFTLVEMLVVLAIMAILLGLGAGGYAIARKRASETKTKGAIMKLKIAIESYKKKYGYYPQEATYGVSVSSVPVEGGGSSNTFKGFLVPSTNDDKLAKFLNIKDYTTNNTDTFTSKTIAIDNYVCVIGTIKHKGRPLIYKCPGDKYTDSFDLYSAGPDGDPNTSDDNIWAE